MEAGMEDGGGKDGKKYSQMVYNQLEPRQETLDEMLTRHRKEINKLQKQEIELKKAAAKGSKTDQKAKKKKVEEVITQLSTQLRKKQTDELTFLGYNNDCNGREKHMDSLVRAVAGVSVSTNECRKSNLSKSMKRRDKKAQEEAERERRIESEKNNIISERFVEMEKLERKLGPVGLTINEVKADGHCLYRAVEDQLAFISGGSSPFTHQELRVMVASYMRKHTSDFLPFFFSENVGEGELEHSILERFEQYCRDIEFTAAWGGHLELEALAHCLMKHIIVFSGSFPDVELGNEYKGDRSNTCVNPSIMLSFHRHAFGLGEHYNSVIVDSSI